MSSVPIRNLFLFSTALLIRPCQAFSLSEWLSKDPYEDGGTVQEQIQCYALPYGAIGMASHILTYFTAYMLSRGRNPILVWKRLKHRRFNLSVAAVGFVITLVLTSLTMARCRRTWPFILVAVWKLVLSVTLTGMTIQAAWETHDEPKKEKQPKVVEEEQGYFVYGDGGYGYDYPESTYQRTPTDDRPGPRTSAADVHLGHYYPLKAPMGTGSRVRLTQREDDGDDDEWHGYHLPGLKGRYHRVWYWVPLYVLGVVVGFVGIMNIVSKHIMGNQQLRIITGVFGGVVLLMVMVVIVLSWLMMSGSGGCVGIVGVGCLAATGVAVFMLSVLFAFYTDWVLAALAEDLVGTPSRDNAVFYWTYFAAKRLPMVSF
ncbi:hypothetical protein QC761_401365 [Podospora bellae-mahoneyi]|uniref:Uncharacterized protein n=1 Tax=Podospora bellae-mahoneyi TaxID=2093777 RepID=A0ABR0FID6_9PEZI|nr:hypothetical protein QC761_401365 [Podospora bellae-mahoneyi]